MTHEDPTDHLIGFLQATPTLKKTNVPDEYIKLKLFPYYLKGKARAWLHSHPPGHFTTWDDLSKAFLTKYYPPSMTSQVRNDIQTFSQDELESMGEAWERFKDLQRKCPHHGIPTWSLVQTFYTGLSPRYKDQVNLSAGGAFLDLAEADGKALIEKMAAPTSNGD